jgi:zinc and cadmium transporter
MTDATLITLYSLAVVASSLFGGWLPSLFRLTHVRMQLVLSFVGGMMLGVGLLHMLPHSYVELGSLDASLVWLLGGLLGMFLLIRAFHFHEHPHDEHPHEEHPHDEHSCAEQGPATYGRVGAERGGLEGRPPLSSLSWIGVACGLSLHAFLDGIALAAGVISDSTHRGESWWSGLGVFLAILLHKPLDALSITTLMQARHWPRRAQQTVNAGFAMMCPLGAGGFALWVDRAGTAQHRLVGIALAVSAGVFLCISLSDLLPEVQFHRHDRMKLSAALIVGVLCAYGIHYFEPPHAHSSQGAPEHSHDAHSHDAHSHDDHSPGARAGAGGEGTELVRFREMRNLGDLSRPGEA